MKSPRSLINLFVACAALAAASLLTGCGQVITRPTPTPTATATARVAAITVAATSRPTSTPAPYTPAPTATPTITPTPIIYRIASGDNLMKIATKFNVSLAGIQDANGITDPRSLRVGQELIIPVEEAVSPDATATPESTPMPFQVANLTFSNTPFGGLWAFGEIINTTGSELEQAGVMVALLDEAGAVVAQEQTFVAIDLLQPGEKAPFAVRFTAPPQSFSTYQALPWKGVQGYVGSYYLDLQARNTAGSGERYTAYTVTGSVANVGPEDAVEVTVTVTLYDALGRVVGMRKVVPEHNVVPRGGETTFTAELTPAGGPVASFAAHALGRRLPTPTP